MLLRRQASLRVVFLMAMAFGVGGSKSIEPPDEIVATLGPTPVFSEELYLHRADQTALVAVYFKRVHGVDLTEAVWNQRFRGEVPAERLRNQAREACLRDKAIQVLAAERGVGRLLPFPGFQAYCERVNRARRQALAAGQTLHGPVDYTPWQLYRYEVDNLRIQLRNALSADPGDAEASEATLGRAIAERLASAALASPKPGREERKDRTCDE